MPKNNTFATLITEQGPGLGIRTEKGILNVMNAEADLRTGAPVTLDDVIQQQSNLGALATPCGYRRRCRAMSAVGGKAENFCSFSDFGF